MSLPERRGDYYSREQRGAHMQQRLEQTGQLIVGRGLDADFHEVNRIDFPDRPEGARRLEGKIAGWRLPDHQTVHPDFFTKVFYIIVTRIKGHFPE
ncbi:MAG: hypothetical protein PHE83_07455 [Opitutaceae bacterium]|nr:hypothetical protein [Opitutaceae bacterium]